MLASKREMRERRGPRDGTAGWGSVTAAECEADFDCFRLLLHGMLARWQATHVTAEGAAGEAEEAGGADWGGSGWQRFLLSLQKSHTSFEYGPLRRLPV